MFQFRHYLKKLIIVFFMAALANCTSIPKTTFKSFMESFGIPQFTDEKKPNHLELENIVRIENLITERQFNAAYSMTKKFQQMYKYSEYLLWIQVLEGETLAGMEMHSEAIQIFQSVILTAASSNDEITSYALFFQAKSYESLGESENALASFLDVLTRRSALPNYISEIELPMEMAQTYASLGLQSEFNDYSNKALAGLNQFLQSRILSDRQKAQFFLRLGRMGPWQIRSSQYEQDFSRDQSRLMLILRSVQIEAQPESKDASYYLLQTLKEYEQMVQQFDVPLDREQRIQAYERRQSLGFSLLDTLLNLSEATNENAVAGSVEYSVRSYLAEAIVRTQTLLETVMIRNPLTKESIQYRNIKKTILTKPNLFFSDEVKRNISNPKKDPNL